MCEATFSCHLMDNLPKESIKIYTLYTAIEEGFATASYTIFSVLEQNKYSYALMLPVPHAPFISLHVPFNSILEHPKEIVRIFEIACNTPAAKLVAIIENKVVVTPAPHHV